jgi:hypothetical protein
MPFLSEHMRKDVEGKETTEKKNTLPDSVAEELYTCPVENLALGEKVNHKLLIFPRRYVGKIDVLEFPIKHSFCDLPLERVQGIGRL